MKRLFSAPTTVNLELTELCNVKCRHCYNFWRDESAGVAALNTRTLDLVLDKMAEAGVFHMILSGGEPFSQFDLLEYAVRGVISRGMSVSCNSNLMLATPERIRRLLDAGLDHILTSAPTHDPVLNDRIMNHPGAFGRLIAGIRVATGEGMRVSANMVITRRNRTHVRDTGRMVAELGCQKLFVTRSVPPTYADPALEDDYALTPDEVREVLDDALWVRDACNIMIGSLVSYPLCFLGDLEKYADFVGRGCPSQSGHRMSVNANGAIHACVHEEESYGDVFKGSVTEAYQTKMRKWHDGRFHYAGCQGCEYANVCESGCSMMALGHYGDHAERDPLFVGPHGIYRPYRFTPDEAVYREIDAGLRFIVPGRLRFRAEAGFHLVNIRWGNSITLPDPVAHWLKNWRDAGTPFSLRDFTVGDRVLLARLFHKDVIELETPRTEPHFQRRMDGLSINLEDLPDVEAV